MEQQPNETNVVIMLVSIAALFYGMYVLFTI